MKPRLHRSWIKFHNSPFLLPMPPPTFPFILMLELAMGEIDTKPIESVQSAITFFGQSNDQRKNGPTNDKEMDIERLERELASVRVQLDSKEAAQKQALIKLDHYQKTIDELSSLLKNSDAKKNFYISQSEEATSRVAELESALQSSARKLAKLEQLRAEADSASARLQTECSAKEAEAKRAREQEKEAQVEIALLKFQLHKGRSRVAAAEAAEARAQSEKTTLYNALQQLGMEAEEAKKENRMLKEAATLAEPQENKEIVGGGEMEGVKRELEAAVGKIGEMRTRLEQAASRAEAAERARAALEEQNRRRREHKERRKAAYAALRLETVAREFVEGGGGEDEGIENGRIYQPLGKVLNMKF